MAAFNESAPVKDDSPAKKILFLGDEKIGKTTFIRTYCDYMRQNFGCETYSGEFLVFHQTLLDRELFGKMVSIRFLDLPPGVTEESREGQYPCEVSLVVLCFAIDDPTSLYNACERWLPEVRELYSNSNLFYLLGLKQDMRLQMEAEGMNPVMAERGLRAHRDFHFCGRYMECSVEGNPEKARSLMDDFVHVACNTEPLRLQV